MASTSNGNGRSRAGIALDSFTEENSAFQTPYFPRSYPKTRIERAVENGLRQWKRRKTAVPDGGAHKPLLPPEVRRRLYDPALVSVHPPMMRQLKFKASIWLVLRRLIQLFGVVIFWYLTHLVDVIRRRATVERRARRARAIIEWLGGTSVKLGQQAAMRIDLLPYAYSVELSKMLDSSPPFPTEYAIRRIEEALGGRPMADVFDGFDPHPIGSASVACVYQAYLKTGERVAIKVRRPKIGEQFVADCAGLGILLKFLELLTILRPGMSLNFLFDYRSMLLEELDFYKEARYNELFRRRVRKHLDKVTAPRVYFEYCSGDVLVTEFVSGIWLRELITAVEQRDHEALRLLREQGIDPKIVARRLLRANQYGVFENLLFHADPHPSNVVVQAGGGLTFIDFGSCGAYTTKERNNWRQLVYYHDQEDIGRMVQTALAILEPLPPIDIDEFSKRLETIFWDDLYAFKSKHSQWWERTSAKIWIRFLALSREYGIALNLNTLRMIRATLLYETIAARLYPNISVYREHRLHNRSAGERARKRVRNQISRWIFQGPSKTDYLRIEQVMEMGNRFLYLAQRHLDAPPFRFSLLVSKATYAITVTVRALIWLVLWTMATAGALVLWRLFFKPAYTMADVDFWRVTVELFGKVPFQIVLGIGVVSVSRRILFRFFDKEIADNGSGLS